MCILRDMGAGGVGNGAFTTGPEQLGVFEEFFRIQGQDPSDVWKRWFCCVNWSGAKLEAEVTVIVAEASEDHCGAACDRSHLVSGGTESKGFKTLICPLNRFVQTGCEW